MEVKEAAVLTIGLNRELMLDMYIFETAQLLEQLEIILLDSEKDCRYSQNAVNEIFRIMHTIKGSSGMMMYNEIATLSHSIEDLFYFIREKTPENLDCSSLSDLMLSCVDFIKVELEKIKNGEEEMSDSLVLKENIRVYLSELEQNNFLVSEGIAEDPIQDVITQTCHPNADFISSYKNSYKAIINFIDGCEMENIRAFNIIHNLKEITEEYHHFPEDIIDESSSEVIRKLGFTIFFGTDITYNEIQQFFQKVIYLKDIEITQVEKDSVINDKLPKQQNSKPRNDQDRSGQTNTHQSIISVSVDKLDKLMDLVGELVISEAMVTQNPDLKGLELENFHKASNQLRKITSNLQDMIMSIRMVPLSSTFLKMNRLIRDMSKKLNKDIELNIIGEETEVDKNIIEHIADPLMHLIRNSIDHGIETQEERREAGKVGTAKVTLEAKNAGGEVLILVKDNGRGLNKEKILKRAKENGILQRSEFEMTDKEIYALIFLPGFSTKENVSEFSGRGVGMDVVVKNIEMIGGTVLIDSIHGEGTTITLKIPLTLAIIDGMNIRVGNSRYTIPLTDIKESFITKETDVITDPDGNEMIMIRGCCYSILRLNEQFKVKTDVSTISNGIVLMVENENKTLCIVADELMGEQQVVVKALPNYIKNTKKIKGVAGCTLLGDGSISLILDIVGLMN